MKFTFAILALFLATPAHADSREAAGCSPMFKPDLRKVNAEPHWKRFIEALKRDGAVPTSCYRTEKCQKFLQSHGGPFTSPKLSMHVNGIACSFLVRDMSKIKVHQNLLQGTPHEIYKVSSSVVEVDSRQGAVNFDNAKLSEEDILYIKSMRLQPTGDGRTCDQPLTACPGGALPVVDPETCAQTCP